MGFKGWVAVIAIIIAQMAMLRYVAIAFGGAYALVETGLFLMLAVAVGIIRRRRTARHKFSTITHPFA